MRYVLGISACLDIYFPHHCMSLYIHPNVSIIQATGSQIGFLFQITVAILASIVIAFTFSWSTTLVTIGVLPLLVAGGLLQRIASGLAAQRQRKALEAAGKVRLGIDINFTCNNIHE